MSTKSTYCAKPVYSQLGYVAGYCTKSIGHTNACAVLGVTAEALTYGASDKRRECGCIDHWLDDYREYTTPCQAHAPGTLSSSSSGGEAR